MKLYQSLIENVYVSKTGDIFYKDINNEATPLHKFYDKKQGYYIVHNDKNIFIIDLMMDIFIGKSSLKKKYRNSIFEDYDITNMTYVFDNLIHTTNSVLLDGEEFKLINLEKRKLYINEYGVIYDLDKSKFIIPYIKDRKDDPINHEYKDISISGFHEKVHRLLYKTFYPEINIDGHHVHHKNNNKLDNHIGNLEHLTIHEHSLLTRIENSEKTYPIRWSEEIIHRICLNLQNNISNIELCKELNMYDDRRLRKDFTNLVSDIYNKNIWAHISSKYDFSNYDSKYHFTKLNAVYTHEQIHLVCKMIAAGIRGREIIKKTGIDSASLYVVRNRIAWRHVSSLYF
jgi:hypothetical protein